MNARPLPPYAQLLHRAEVLLHASDRDHALAQAAIALSHASSPPDALKVARFLMQARAYREALNAYQRAWDLSSAADEGKPMRAAILTDRALLWRYLGEPDQARREYCEAISLDPGAAAALKGLTEMSVQTATSHVLPELHTALARVPGDSRAAALVYFAMAKTFDDLEVPYESWQCLAHGNRIERARNGYDPDTDANLMAAIAGAFPDIELFDATVSTHVPIFILGLPRTGTTLLERILSSHRQIECGGELTAMPQALQPYGRDDPRATALNLSQATGSALALAYLKRARAVGVTSSSWTDKQCLNFLYCPLLLRAFPRAKLISLTRHPMATVYAIFRTFFPDTYPFAYDVREIADFYINRAMLMDHWRACLPGRFIEVSYENLVLDFDRTVRDLLTALKLPFDPACLAFDRSREPVLTMSAEQVREPLYASSVESWRRYAAQLARARRRFESAGIDCN